MHPVQRLNLIYNVLSITTKNIKEFFYAKIGSAENLFAQMINRSTNVYTYTCV